MANYTKAEALDLATIDGYAISQVIGSGTPVSTYNELWYKYLLHGNSYMYAISVWNEGGTTYEIIIPGEDESLGSPYDAEPGAAYPCKVTVYDSSDVVLATGHHVEFTNVGRWNTWVYIKVEQPAPHFPQALVCYARTKLYNFYPLPILEGSVFIQDEVSTGPVMAFPGGYGVYDNPFNVLVGETGHTVGGGAGDVLFNGISCIVDQAINGITVRNRYYMAPYYLPNIGTVHHIKRNGDGLTNFWVSYTTGATNIVRALTITGIPATLEAPVDLSWGPIMGITGIVDRMCARSNQILYYTLQGSNIIRRWNIATNTPFTDLIPDLGLGTVTDILVLTDGNVLIGYNSLTSPTMYSIRMHDGITGAPLQSHGFVSQGQYNRMNYGETSAFFYVWTHDMLGESTVRKVRVVDGVIVWTSKYREFENGRLILDQEMYAGPNGGPSDPVQFFGTTNKFNFWVSPVEFTPYGTRADNSGFFNVPTNVKPPDAYYPPGITYPPIGSVGGPAAPYPGYPWFPPPPGMITDPVHDVPVPVQIGGGLIILDASNTERQDQYLNTDGLPLKVPISVTIRTAFLETNMSKGSATSEGSGGENVQHFSTIRIRATGQGQLKLAVHSLDYVKSKLLVPLTLENQSRIIPNRIVNFVEQRAAFELYTNEPNDYVRINRIVVYMKEIYTSTPGA